VDTTEYQETLMFSWSKVSKGPRSRGMS